MRDVLHVYGMFFGFAVFAISAWISVSALSEGMIPGAHGATASATAPLGIACFIMMVHCLIRLVKETR